MVDGLILDAGATGEAVTGGSITADRIRLLLQQAITGAGWPVRIPTLHIGVDITDLVRLAEYTAGSVVVSTASPHMIITASRLAVEHPWLGVTDAQAVLEAMILSWTVVTIGPERVESYHRLGARAIDVTTT